MLTFGIPGDIVTAILIGAFIAQGLSPGPTLIPENPEIIYSLFMSMFIATCIMFAAAMATVKIWVKVLKIPQRILYPIVVVLSVAGSYAINSSMFDVGTMFMFGFMGYVMRKMDFPIPPVMLAFVLTPMLEPHLRQALLISKGSVMIFITHPISAAFLILTVGVVLQVVIREMVQRRKEKGKGESPAFP
jgi:putative tricarboxylic transport membrane protein